MIIGAHRIDDETLRLHEYSPGRDTAAFAFDPQRFAAHEKFFVEDVRRWAATRLAVRLPAARTAVFGVSASAELALAMGMRDAFSPQMIDRLHERLGAVVAVAVGEFDRARTWEVEGATSMVAWLRDRGGLARGQAVGLVLLHARAALSGGDGRGSGGRQFCYRSPKIVRCQSFLATAVLSNMTCLIWVYSSME